MEKLAEINIVVKNHMSLLQDVELDALFKHIGIIKYDTEKKVPDQIDKAVVSQTFVKADLPKDVKKEKKTGPTIIRKTEIIIDTKNDTIKSYDVTHPNKNKTTFTNNIKALNTDDKKKNIVNVYTEESRLMPGLVVKSNSNYGYNNKKEVNNIERAGLKSNPEKRASLLKEPEKNRPAKEKEDLNITGNNTNEVLHDTDLNKKAVVEDERKFKVLNVKNPNEIITNTTSIITNKIDIDKGNSQTIRDKDDKKDTSDDSKNKITKPNNVITNVSTNNKTEESKSFVTKNPTSRPPYNRDQDKSSNNKRPLTSNNKNDRGPQRFNNDKKPISGVGQSANSYANRNSRPGSDSNYKKDSRPTVQSKGYQQRGTSNNSRPENIGQRTNWSNSTNTGLSSGDKFSGIPRADNSTLLKEVFNVNRTDSKRPTHVKDSDNDAKKDIANRRSNISKGNDKYKPQKHVLTEKKGISEVLSEDYILEEFYNNDNVKKTRRVVKQKKDLKSMQNNMLQTPKAVLVSIKVGDYILVKELAEKLKKTSTEIIKKLMTFGIMATLNQEIDFDTACIIGEEFNVKVEKEVVVSEEDILFDDAEDAPENLEPRPPVVVVMGHVDHGKTSLLDAIRQTNVIESEAGGITQHIGAYMVKINNKNITFLDTPGHEAFTAMRARGAQITDIAILVVAADDGIMQQTIEAINHAKAANVSIIIAINKIDKPGANVDKVKQELTGYGLVTEEWGGDTICVSVSAKKRENIDHLLEMVLLAADMLELKANPNKQAKGTIVEAKLDKDKGPTATILVQRGTLNVGDSIIAGTIMGRIKAMMDDKGNKIKHAGPSMPVEVLGFSEVPEAGEMFYAITDEKVARHLTGKRKFQQREQNLRSSARVSLDDLFNQIKEGKVKDLNIIVKADVQGSVEAIKQSLTKLTSDEVRVNVIHCAVGAITESDVTLAQVSNAIIIGFNVRPGANVSDMAKNVGVDMRLYRVIYNAIEDIQAAMKGMLDPTFKETILGHIEIRQLFKVSGIGVVSGAYVIDGKITRNSEVRVVRDGIVVHEGKLASLKRFKDDAKEVAQGYECGILLERYNDIKQGDVVESFIMEEVER